MFTGNTESAESKTSAVVRGGEVVKLMNNRGKATRGK
jgi:hypothetical protein